MKLNELKVDNPYLKLPKNFYDFVNPAPLNRAYLISANKEVAKLLDIDKEELDKKEFVDFINGNSLLKGSKPFAMVYAGHQFGHFVPRLGDGRAINIGTINNFHLQLKGSGPTKYSRSGDGRAVLRSSIREYLISEAMHNLNIPTTRALGVIGSEHGVYRDEWEEGAITLRVSPSWIRIGTFEYFANKRDIKSLKLLSDYAIKESYPHLENESNKYLYFFLEVVGKSAKLVAKWQSVGFNHGVMNTDNISIAGVTLDYGPFAFLDDYEFNYICNKSDRNGRYSFANQAGIMKWNLNALKYTLSFLTNKDELDKALEYFDRIYAREFISLMRKKLGLTKELDEDIELIRELLETLEELSIDYTLFFRTLSSYNKEKKPLLDLALFHNPLKSWLNRYDKRLEKEPLLQKQREELMLKTNPKYVLKNYMLQEAIDKAKNRDFSVVEALLEIAKNPFKEHKAYEKWAKATPSEFKNQILSCSS